MNWKEYTQDRLVAQHPSGFYVIKPKVPLEGRPLFCPLCDWVMNSTYDPEAYSKFGCCDGCAASWAYPNQQMWNDGWRPTREEARNKRRRPDM